MRRGFEEFGSLADSLREQPEEIGRPWLKQVTGIYLALQASLRDLLDAQPEHVVAMVAHLAESDDVNTRIAATDGIKHAYRSSPEASRPLISRLLTDEDPRIRTAAHGKLSGFIDDIADPDSHGKNCLIVDFDYLVSLPIHSLIINSYGLSGKEFLAESYPEEYFSPFSYGK